MNQDDSGVRMLEECTEKPKLVLLLLESRLERMFRYCVCSFGIRSGPKHRKNTFLIDDHHQAACLLDRGKRRLII